MGCTKEQDAVLKAVSNLSKGVDVIFKDTPIPGSDSSKENKIMVEGKSATIEGKDVRTIENFKADIPGRIANLGIGFALGIVFPPIFAFALIKEFGGAFLDLARLSRNIETDFFRTEIKDQFETKFNDTYRDCQAEDHNMSQRIEVAENRIADLSSRLESLPSDSPQRGAMEAEIAKLKVELEGDGKNSGLIQEREELRADMAKMEIAIEEIKDASTNNGVPSLETLALFNSHSAYTDSNGEFHPGDLYRDIEGAEQYYKHLCESYISENRPTESSINDMINEIGSRTAAAEEMGIVGFNIQNMSVAEDYVKLIECLPDDCNPREVISPEMEARAQEANAALASIDWSAFTTDPKYEEMAKAFNERFDAAQDRQEYLQHRHDRDNSRDHKGKDKDKDDSGLDPNDPNNPLNPGRGGA